MLIKNYIKIFFGKFGFQIKQIDKVIWELNKAKKIKNISNRLKAAQTILSKHPNFPHCHLLIAECLYLLANEEAFGYFHNYGKLREEWLFETGLDKLNTEFIWQGMFTGSLGNHYAIESLINANRTGLRKNRQLLVLLGKKNILRNPALFEYFKPFITVINDQNTINNMRDLESVLTLPLGLCLPIHDSCPYLDIAANVTQKALIENKILNPFLSLKDEHTEKGKKYLKKLGLPDNAWYVTLHLREPGYRGETDKNTTEDWRNVNPLDYIKAIKTITKSGGWVFRMGNSSMTKLPEIPQLIDYAHLEDRPDWMDIFLGATCRFCIGTSSGFYVFLIVTFIKNLNNNLIKS